MERVTVGRRWRKVRVMAAGAGLALLLATTGCGAFFQCEGKADCPSSGSGTGSGSGDYAYISNSASGSNDLDGFDISTGALVTATGFPMSLGYEPTGMVVTPNNDYLYVAAVATSAIYGFSIGTGGALSTINSGAALESESSLGLAVSPDNNWLFSLNSNDTTIEEYQITSGGALNAVNNYQLTNTSGALITSSAITVAPSGQYIAVSMGLAGVEIFTFNTSTGDVEYASQISGFGSTSGAYALTADSNNNLYVTTTNELYTYSVTSAGNPTQLTKTATGVGPYSIALDGTSYVYTGYQTDATPSSPLISGLTVSTVSPLTGSSYVAPANVAALGVDNTSKYLVAAGYNGTSGIQLFSISSTGTIQSVASTGSGTNQGVPTIVALTH